MTNPYANLDDAPSCQYCVVLSGIDTPHWPITYLTRREKRKLHAAWHSKDSEQVQRIITAAMARGDYSWVAGTGCKVRDALIPQERKWRPVPDETPMPLVRILAAVALVVLFLVVLPTLVIVGLSKPETEYVPQQSIFAEFQESDESATNDLAYCTVYQCQDSACSNRISLRRVPASAPEGGGLQAVDVKVRDDALFLFAVSCTNTEGIEGGMATLKDQSQEPEPPQAGATDHRNWIANSSAVIACQMQPALCDALKDYYNVAGFVARQDGTVGDCIARRMDDTDIDTAIEVCLKENAR